MPIEFDHYAAANAAIDLESNAARILEFLAANPELGFTPKEIHEETGIPRGSVGTTLRRLAERALVRHKEPYWAVNHRGLDTAEALPTSVKTVEESTTYDWADADPAEYRIGLDAVSEEDH